MPYFIIKNSMAQWKDSPVNVSEQQETSSDLLVIQGYTPSPSGVQCKYLDMKIGYIWCNLQHMPLCCRICQISHHKQHGAIERLHVGAQQDTNSDVKLMHWYTPSPTGVENKIHLLQASTNGTSCVCLPSSGFCSALFSRDYFTPGDTMMKLNTFSFKSLL